MDEATSAQLMELHEKRQKRVTELEAVLRDHKLMLDQMADDAQPSPSREEQIEMHDRIVAAEAAVQDVQEEIRKIEWAEAGIEEQSAQQLRVGEE